MLIFEAYRHHINIAYIRICTYRLYSHMYSTAQQQVSYMQHHAYNGYA